MTSAVANHEQQGALWRNTTSTQSVSTHLNVSQVSNQSDSALECYLTLVVTAGADRFVWILESQSVSLAILSAAPCFPEDFAHVLLLLLLGCVDSRVALFG